MTDLPLPNNDPEAPITPISNTHWGKDYGSYERVQAAFDRWADTYFSDLERTGGHIQFFKYIMPFISPPDAPVHDFGCGPGNGAMPFVRSSCEVIGYDLSPRMLNQAKDRGYQDCVCLDLSNPDAYKDIPAFKYGLSFGLIGDYIPHEPYLDLLRRKLQPGGWLVFTVERNHATQHPLPKDYQLLGSIVLGTDPAVVPEELNVYGLKT